MVSAKKEFIRATRKLAADVDRLPRPKSVSHVYNPLDYAWEAHRQYLDRFGDGPKRVLFLGMNPGPFGMAQTGVPFGEVAAVRDWMGIEAAITPPPNRHPRKPVEGFSCKRSEVSGRRLWGLFAERFGSPEQFFADHFVYNYCPLLFIAAGSGARNLPPENLRQADCQALYTLCDAHLIRLVKLMQIEWAVGVGAFAERRLRAVFGTDAVKVGKILHPSPASPAANRGWAAQATRQLVDLHVWETAS